MEAAEFPFMADVQKSDRSILGQLWDSIHEMAALQRQTGPVLPQNVARDALCVSATRVNQLIDAGILESVMMGGRRFITWRSMIAYAQAERSKGGRPRTVVESALDSLADGVADRLVKTR